MFKRIQEGIKGARKFYNVLEWSRKFKNVLEGSRRFNKSKEGSYRFKMVRLSYTDCWKVI